MTTAAPSMQKTSSGLAATWLTQKQRFAALLGDSSFDPARCFVQRRDGVTLPFRPADGKPYWVLARSLVRVKSVALPRLEPRQARGAIALELAAWTPFEDSAYYVEPHARGAVLYAWDAALVSAAIDSTQAGEVTVVPESALRVASADGISLSETLEGVEARSTVSGALETTQWWPQVPSAAEWRNFCRVSGGAATDAVPEPEAASAWRKRPLGTAADGASHADRRAEFGWLALAVFLLLVPTLWYANEARQLIFAQRDADERLAATERELEGVLSSRNAALDAQGRAAQMSRLLSTPDVALVSAQVAELLGTTMGSPGGYQLTDFEWRDRRARLTVQMNPGATTPAVTQLVRAFEAMAAYSDVKISAEGGRINIEFVVTHNSTAARP